MLTNEAPPVKRLSLMPVLLQRRQDTVSVTVTESPPQAAPITTLEPANAVVTSAITSPTVHVNSVPEIDGSEGGFIGLVIGLGILVIICCVTVFFLLRNRESGGNPSKRRNRDMGSSGPGNVGGAIESDFPTRERGFFGSRAGRYGWTRTADENDDSDGERDGVKLAGLRARSASPNSAVEGSREGHSPYMHATHHARSASSTSSSASTIRLHSAAQEPNLWQSDDHDDESPKHFSPPHPHGFGGSKFHEEII